jgi:hypothetical protein
MVLACIVACAGCSSPEGNYNAINSFYRYDFPAAREALRADAMTRNDQQVVLNNTRLGIAALADGDLHEAEIALGRSFELLSTAGLNKDKTIAAVLDHEGVRIWKGEPFEQALTYYYVSTLYALMGDWENARAAAANSLFRLTDFGRDQNPEKLARRAAEDPKYLEKGYTAVDTNFALGFLMQAISSDLSGAAGSAAQFDAAAQTNPDLQELIDQLRQRHYDTLLIVDYGKGPTKIAYGPDEALVRFSPQDQMTGALSVSAGGAQIANVSPICDVNDMSIDHRWNNLENVRQAKSAIGTALLYGGMFATAYGADRHDEGTAFAGLAAMGLGALTKAGAKGDTRYCEFMPASIYLVPLELREAGDLRISIEGDPTSLLILDDVQPGIEGKPQVVYVRLLGPGSPKPDWLARRKAIYGNDATGVQPGDFPYILGGNDVSTPDRKTLEAYHAHGFLLDMTVSDLKALYEAEGILVGSGMENRPDTLRNPSFRHVLEGGTGLFTPKLNSIGYKRLMCRTHEPYEPKSEWVRNVAASVGVTQARNTHSANVVVGQEINQ